MGSGQARGGARRSARGLGRGGSPSVAGAGTPAAGICARYKWGVGRPSRVGWVAGRSHSGGWLRRSEYFWTHSGGQEQPAGPKKARAKGSYMWVALVWVAWPCARRAWMMGPPKKVDFRLGGGLPAGQKGARAKGSYMWAALVRAAWPCVRSRLSTIRSTSDQFDAGGT